MDHRITRVSHCKIYLLLLNWLRARLGHCGERVFAATDATARRRDWQIVVTHAGLGRQYRDPRFDTLAACPSCGGRGARTPGDPCQACAGTGRITVAIQTALQVPHRWSA